MTDPDLSEILATLAAEHAAVARRLEALGKQIADVASRIWDARLATTPTDTAVRPKMYTYALDAARRIARRGDRLSQSKLFGEIREVDCAAVKEHEKEPLWKYITELTGAEE